MTWMTRKIVKVDREAGPWFIQRLIVDDALYAECQRRLVSAN
jgi:hypothetical protein